MTTSEASRALRRLFTSTPVRTFLLYPLAVIAFELAIRRGDLVFVPWGALLLAWGYLQYRLTGHYRLHRGGGGPGFTVPPDRLVTEATPTPATRCISGISSSCSGWR